MSCPSCGDLNAYNGMNGWSCPNQVCNFFDSNATISPVSINQTIPLFSNPAVFGNGCTTTRINQKIIVNEVLNAISTTINLRYPIVAGGAPRTWKVFKTATTRDVDIYVYFHKDLDDTTLASEFSYLESCLKTKITMIPTPIVRGSTYTNRWIKNIYEFAYKGQEFQIMVVRSYSEIKNPTFISENYKSFSNHVFETFDFGICKISYFIINKAPVEVIHQYCKNDINNKTLTLDIKELKKNNINGMSKLLQRYQKMKSYFPDYELILV